MKVTVFSNSKGEILGIIQVEEEALKQGIRAELMPKRGQKVYEVDLPKELEQESLLTIYNEFRLNLKGASPSLEKKKQK